MELRFKGISENESFARMCAAAFAALLDPTLEQIADIKTAVSEAVTNCVVHAYNGSAGEIILSGRITGNIISYCIKDNGVGIDDVEKARQPFFTTSGNGDRSGMGFTVMSAFMDEVIVESKPNVGTTVILKKRIEH